MPTRRAGASPPQDTISVLLPGFPIPSPAQASHEVPKGQSGGHPSHVHAGGYGGTALPPKPCHSLQQCLRGHAEPPV